MQQFTIYLQSTQLWPTDNQDKHCTEEWNRFKGYTAKKISKTVLGAYGLSRRPRYHPGQKRTARGTYPGMPVMGWRWRRRRRVRVRRTQLQALERPNEKIQLHPVMEGRLRHNPVTQERADTL